MANITVDRLYQSFKANIREGTGAYDLTSNNHIYVIDTPHMWGVDFADKGAIQEYGARAKTDINLALETIIESATHTLDIVSLAPPTGLFEQTIFKGLTKKLETNGLKQVRILFGYLPAGEDTVKKFRINLATHLKNALGKSLLAPNTQIYVGRVHGGASGGGGGPLSPWNHAKIIAADGKYALVGGHNLWPHNYADYPPVHDISLFVCGEAAHSAQKFADMLWTIPGTNVSGRNTWTRFYKFDYGNWTFPGHTGLSLNRWEKTPPNPSKKVEGAVEIPQWARNPSRTSSAQILGVSRFPTSDRVLNGHAGITTPSYASPSEKAKEIVVKSATNRLYICQQDLLFQGASKIADHKTIHWITEALENNPRLHVKIVVSSINAKSKDGSAYSWGSGAFGTYREIYKILHGKYSKHSSKWEDIISRLHVAPFCFTSVNISRYGHGHSWGNTQKYGGKSAQFSTSVPIPKMLSSKYPEPANHSKFYLANNLDGQSVFYVGSDNMYPHDLFEYGYMVSDNTEALSIYENYWSNVWKYSGPNCVCVSCRKGWRAILNDTVLDYKASLNEKFRRPSADSAKALALLESFLLTDPSPSESGCRYMGLLLLDELDKWDKKEPIPPECNTPQIKRRDFKKPGTTFCELLKDNVRYSVSYAEGLKS